MAKISQTQSSSEYKTVRTTGEKNDCAVVCVASVCGVSYQVAYDKLKQLGRKPGKGAYTSQIFGAISDFGFGARLVLTRKIIDSFPGVHKNLKNITTYHPRRFPESFDRTKVYMAFTVNKRHVLSIVDGKTVDWSANKALRIGLIYEVFKREV